MKNIVLVFAATMLLPFSIDSASIKPIPQTASRQIRVKPLKAPRTQAADVFHEGFENPTSDKTWLPEGWARTSTYNSTDPEDHWFCYPAFVDVPTHDGSFYMWLLPSSRYQDERLISPPIQINGNEQLSYHLFFVPLYFFNLDSQHFNWDTNEFILRERSTNFEVMVKVEGSDEWVTVQDIGSRYDNVPDEDLIFDVTFALQQQVVDLSEYAGKTIRIAFRYSGTDGNAFYLDDVRVGLQPLDAAFEPPFSSLFSGLSADWTARNEIIEVFPVNAPLTFYEAGENFGLINYLWTYSDPDDPFGQELTTATTNDLTVTYRPTYTSDDAHAVSNRHAYPKLELSSPAGNYGIAEREGVILQAGGDAVLNGVHFGLMPFAPQHGMTYYRLEPLDFGEYSIPAFGYSKDVDNYWVEFLLNGNERDSEVESYITSFGNLQFPPEAPMVVEGANVPVFGKMPLDVEFTLKIWSLNDDGELPDAPLATASCNPTMIYEDLTGLDDLMLSFRFDNPVVLSEEGCGYGYLIEVDGIHNPRITYITPLHSESQNALGFGVGLARCFIHYPKFGADFDCFRYLQDHFRDNGDFILSGFAISLDAYYPWLMAGQESADVTNNTVDIPFEAYHPAEEIEIDAPQWLEVEILGTGFGGALRLGLNENAEEGDKGVLTLSATGCAPLTVNVTAAEKGSASLSTAIVEDNAPADVYNSLGVCVLRNATPDQIRSLPAGIYFSKGKKLIR